MSVQVIIRPKSVQVIIRPKINKCEETLIGKKNCTEIGFVFVLLSLSPAISADGILFVCVLLLQPYSEILSQLSSCEDTFILFTLPCGRVMATVKRIGGVGVGGCR